MKFNCFIAVAVCFGLCCCSRKEVAPPAPLLPVPSESQLAWHEMEMNAFVHFTTNTFTGKEWGYGDEDPSVFNPREADPDQWVRTFQEAGFKGVILTCKHHDGFCLWPSQYTAHSVKGSPWKNGQGDVVRDVSDACRKYGLKFGIYVSPWDRNHKDYGREAYITYYRQQLTELFTRYGPVFEMWFDGANGGDGFYGGAREKRSIDGAAYYQWPATLDLVRKLEPGVIFFSDAGPGVRWVGNEKGVAGETNWNTITPDTLYAGKGGIETLLNTGSEGGTAWIPAEVDVSIRPGWFYHEAEDTLVKSGERLLEIYLSSVGRGSTLLLNVPPDRRGLLHENDVESLKRFRRLLDQEFKSNLARKASVQASSVRGSAHEFAASNITDENPDTYWATDDAVTTGSVEIELSGEETIHYAILAEYIRLGQRVQAFSVDVWTDGRWQPAARATTIGYKRILKLHPVKTNKVRFNFTGARGCLAIASICIF